MADIRSSSVQTHTSKAPQGREIDEPLSTILLAEDNPVNQEIVRLMLTRLGYSVDVANNGLEILRALSFKPYSLILMDCQMPEMDGFEATRIIRDREALKAQVGSEDSSPQSRIPIVAVTGSALKEEMERCLAVGMDDFLPKPFHLKELQSVLDRWLSHKPARTV